MQAVNIQVRFTINGYSDALYFSLAEWESITPEDLEVQKQARYQGWLNVLNAPPAPEPEPVFEVLNEDGTVFHV